MAIRTEQVRVAEGGGFLHDANQGRVNALKALQVSGRQFKAHAAGFGSSSSTGATAPSPSGGGGGSGCGSVGPGVLMMMPITFSPVSGSGPSCR